MRVLQWSYCVICADKGLDTPLLVCAIERRKMCYSTCIDIHYELKRIRLEGLYKIASAAVYVKGVMVIMFSRNNRPESVIAREECITLKYKPDLHIVPADHVCPDSVRRG